MQLHFIEELKLTGMWKWVVQQAAAGSCNLGSGCVDLLYKALKVKTCHEVQYIRPGLNKFLLNNKNLHLDCQVQLNTQQQAVI